MDVQPITYCGRIVAACTGECFLLADELAYRPPGDPELVFVVMMCSYATDIARGLLPGPFDDVAARRYARAALIPEELLERPELDVDHTAAALGAGSRAASGARRARRVDPPAPVALSAAGREGAPAIPASWAPPQLHDGDVSYRAGRSGSSSLRGRRASAARSALRPRAIHRLTAV